MRRTTILADEALLLEVRQLAAREGVTFTAIVQRALAAYLAAKRSEQQLSIAGIGRSGQGDLAERADELLRAELDPVEGWSPLRAGHDRISRADPD